MNQLSELTDAMEQKFQINLPIISGGNSANYEWFKSAKKVRRINGTLTIFPDQKGVKASPDGEFTSKR